MGQSECEGKVCVGWSGVSVGWSGVSVGWSECGME